MMVTSCKPARRSSRSSRENSESVTKAAACNVGRASLATRLGEAMRAKGPISSRRASRSARHWRACGASARPAALGLSVAPSFSKRRQPSSFSSALMALLNPCWDTNNRFDAWVNEPDSAISRKYASASNLMSVSSRNEPMEPCGDAIHDTAGQLSVPEGCYNSRLYERNFCLFAAADARSYSQGHRAGAPPAHDGLTLRGAIECPSRRPGPYAPPVMPGAE